MNIEPRWKLVVLLVIGGLSIIVLFLLKPIPQPQDYHLFADSRSFLGIPNTLNVLSNLFFVLVGISGLYECVLKRFMNRMAWMIAFVGVTLVGVGSAYYHWMPDDNTLVWDRLPMTIAFMSFLAALLGEYFGARVAKWMLLPALLIGVASVAYWHFANDLRLYAWVVFAPLLIVMALLLLYRSALRRPLFVMLLLYLAAKLAETFDSRIYWALGSTISGHSLKHLFATAACYCMIVMIRTAKLEPMDNSLRDDLT